jgi:hypothetical protein
MHHQANQPKPAVCWRCPTFCFLSIVSLTYLTTTITQQPPRNNPHTRIMAPGRKSTHARDSMPQRAKDRQRPHMLHAANAQLDMGSSSIRNTVVYDTFRSSYPTHSSGMHQQLTLLPAPAARSMTGAIVPHNAARVSAAPFAIY